MSKQEKHAYHDAVTAALLSGIAGTAAVAAIIAFLLWPTPPQQSDFSVSDCPNGWGEQGYKCRTDVVKMTGEERMDNLQGQVQNLKAKVDNLEHLPTVAKEKAKKEADEAKKQPHWIVAPETITIDNFHTSN